MVFFLIKKKFGFYKSGTGWKLVQLVLVMLEHTNFAQDKPRLGTRKETGQFSETLFSSKHPLQVPRWS